MMKFPKNKAVDSFVFGLSIFLARSRIVYVIPRSLIFSDELAMKVLMQLVV